MSVSSQSGGRGGGGGDCRGWEVSREGERGFEESLRVYREFLLPVWGVWVC